MKTTILMAAFIMAASFSGNLAFAQCKTVTWPDSPEMKAKAEENKVLYEDALKSGQFKVAQAPLTWLLTNTPNLHNSIYIQGAEVFDKLASAEKDPARKQVYVDSLMIVYDLRVKTCGEEASVSNRKALSFLKYNLQAKPEESLALLDKTFELNGNNVMDGTLVPYMKAVQVNKLKTKNLTDEIVIERYDKVMGVLDAKIKKAQSEGKDIAKYTQMKDEIDKILISIVKVDCAFVKKNLEPKFKANPTDIVLAKKIFGFMLQGKCTDDPLWVEAGEVIHKLTPVAERDCGLAKNLGIKYLAKENFEKAEELLKEAQTICTDAKDKAEVLIYLGNIEAKKGNKVSARDLFRQSAAADPANAKEAYEKIGDLYYNSFGDCAKKVNQADDRLVYLAAAEYYQRSGNGRKLAMAKEAFPSKEDIFLVNYKVGETKTVGCWIGESVTIKTRD